MAIYLKTTGVLMKLPGKTVASIRAFASVIPSNTKAIGRTSNFETYNMKTMIDKTRRIKGAAIETCTSLIIWRGCNLDDNFNIFLQK